MSHECQNLLAALNQYLDGEIQGTLCQTLQRHLAECPACRLVVDNTQQAIRLFQAEREVELPAGLHNRLLNCLRQHWGKGQPNAPTSVALL